MLAHDVSARAGNVQWGSPSFLLAGFSRGHSNNQETINVAIASTLDQRSANKREGEIPQALEIYVSTLQLTTIMKIAVTMLLPFQTRDLGRGNEVGTDD